MDAVRVAHATEVRDAGQEAHRQPSVHQPIVHQHVGHAEEAHPQADAEGDVRRRAAPVHDEHDGDGRVQDGQRVVELEAAAAPGVVRSMDPPQETVPHLTVKQRGPQLHEAGGRQREDDHHHHGRGAP
jgi:hypothetical protein